MLKSIALRVYMDYEYANIQNSSVMLEFPVIA